MLRRGGACCQRGRRCKWKGTSCRSSFSSATQNAREATSPSEVEIVPGCSLPLQRRVSTQIMRHWEPHLTAQEEVPSARRKHLRMLHCKVPAEGAPGHSILQHDMPEPDCEEACKHKLEHGPVAHPGCMFLGETHTNVRDPAWQSWFCQVLGEPEE